LHNEFHLTIVKELTWEEAERYPLSVEGLPEGVTASDVLLYISVKSKYSSPFLYTTVGFSSAISDKIAVLSSLVSSGTFSAETQ